MNLVCFPTKSKFHSCSSNEKERIVYLSAILGSSCTKQLVYAPKSPKAEVIEWNYSLVFVIHESMKPNKCGDLYIFLHRSSM